MKWFGLNWTISFGLDTTASKKKKSISLLVNLPPLRFCLGEQLRVVPTVVKAVG